MALNAMILKEVQERAPTRRVALLRSAYVLALYGAAFVVFTGGQSGGGESLGQTGRKVFIYLSYLQFFLAAALSPALTANTITKEKLAGTLGILFLSGMKSADIVLGKLLPRLVDLSTAILASLPLVLVYLLFGGVSTAEYVQVYLVMTAVALFSASAGMFFSVVLRNGGTAIILSYVATAVYLFFPSVFPKMGELLYLSPVYCLDQLLDPAGTVKPGAHVALIPLASAAAMSVAFVSLAIAGLQRFAEADLGGMIRTLFEKTDPFIDRFLPKKGIFFQSEGRKYINPFTWRELNAKPLAKFRYLFLMMLAYAAALIVCDIVFREELTGRPPKATPVAAQPSRGSGMGPMGPNTAPAPPWAPAPAPAPVSGPTTGFPETYVFVQIVFLVMIATVLGAGTIAAERESHALDVLLTTPMFPQSYVNGKFLGLFFGCMLFLVPLALHVLFAAAAGWLHWALAGAVILLTPAILACNIAHALYVSLSAPNTVRAVILAILLNCVIFIAVLFPWCFILIPIDPIPFLWFLFFDKRDMLASATGGSNMLFGVVLGVPILGFIIFCANAFYVTAVLGNMVDNFQKRARRHLE